MVKKRDSPLCPCACSFSASPTSCRRRSPGSSRRSAPSFLRAWSSRSPSAFPAAKISKNSSSKLPAPSEPGDSSIPMRDRFRLMLDPFGVCPGERVVPLRRGVLSLLSGSSHSRALPNSFLARPCLSSSPCASSLLTPFSSSSFSSSSMSSAARVRDLDLDRRAEVEEGLVGVRLEGSCSEHHTTPCCSLLPNLLQKVTLHLSGYRRVRY